ncbi:MAG: hypothetical protein V3V99_11900 [candidate division Zixibacteria bacterium]
MIINVEKKNKKMQCNAIAISTKSQCKNKALWGTKYCWVHYPKSQIIVATLFTLIVSILFSEPINYVLSKYTFLNYLDNTSPIITGIFPDVSIEKKVNKTTESFIVYYSEDGAGLDLDKCKIDLRLRNGNSFESIYGKLIQYPESLSFKLDEELAYGDYLMGLLIADKAGNYIKDNYEFSVIEQVDLDVSINYSHITALDIARKFPNFFKTKINNEFADSLGFLLYTIELTNHADNLWIKDLSLTVWLTGLILDWIEVGHDKAEDIESYIKAESMNKLIPKGHLLLGERSLKIDEIAPHGWIKFIALIGLHKISHRGLFNDGYLTLPNTQLENASMYGTYISRWNGKEVRKNVYFTPSADFVE